MIIVGIIGPLSESDVCIGFDSFLECDVHYYNVLFSSLAVGEWFMNQGDSFIKTSASQAEKHAYNAITVHDLKEDHGVLIDEEQFERLGLTVDDLRD